MRKFLAYFHAAFSDTFSYRADIILYFLSSIVTPLVLLAVWLSIESSGGTLPLPAPKLIHYYLWVMVLTVLTAAWASYFISRDIRQGKISSFLLKPVPIVFYQLSNNLAEKVIKTLLLIPVVFIVWRLLQAPLPSLSIIHWTMFVTSVIMAALFRFFADLCIGIAAFWMDDTFALSTGVDFLILLFSGQLLPIIVFPQFIRSILFYAPFRYLFSLPVEIVTGQLSFPQIIQGLLIQLLWVIITLYLYRKMWTQGLIRYSAAGA